MSERIERQFQGITLQLLHEILDKNPHFLFDSLPLQEEGRSDILLRHRETNRNLALIELKDPETTDGRTPYNMNAVSQANSYASNLGCPYFVTWNIIESVLWDRSRPEIPIYESDLEPFRVLTKPEVNHFRKARALTEASKDKAKIFLVKLLTSLSTLFEGRALPLRSIDERFISRLIALIDGYLYPIAEEIQKTYKSNKTLRSQIINWVVKQQYWTWIGKDETLQEEIERLTRLALLFLVNKLIFYKAMQASGVWPLLPMLAFPERIQKAEEAEEYLWKDYFNLVVKKIDYETIFGEEKEVLDGIPFLSDNIADFLREFISQAYFYDFSALPHDIVGRIFERLIREEERHKMGQYFTHPDVVDLINAFCIKNGNEIVLDPGTGSGTFLIRAYARKKEQTGASHSELLEELWGIDIAPYPAHLATLNLAVRDLRLKKNYPQICKKDFFDIYPNNPQTPVKIVTPEGKVIESVVPYVDVVVGNPPYTRQEEIEAIFKGIKEKAWKHVRKEWGYKVSKRAGIHAYFFYHAGTFLKPGGKLGFITSDSWLVVDYGKDLERFFLENFKVIAIIDSKIERWFPDPLVNTAITIIEKCPNEEERLNNIIKFVYLKKPLSEILLRTPTDELTGIIEKAVSLEENELWRIFPIKQKVLVKEALDTEGNFIGANWHKYLLAPDVYFEIIETGKEKLVPLNNIAEVRFGIKTGANKFFHLKDVTDELDGPELKLKFGLTKSGKEKLRVVTSSDGSPHLIEKEFLKPFIKSPLEVKHLEISPTGLVLIVHNEKQALKGKKVLSYINYGEKRGFHKAETCASRSRWWDLGSEIDSPLAFPERFGQRFFVNKNSTRVCLNKSFYGVGDTLHSQNIDVLHAVLNSTVTALFAEVEGRKPGGGSLDLDVWMVKSLKVLDINKLNSQTRKKLTQAVKQISTRAILPISEELKQSDRQTLDELILQGIGFSKAKSKKVLKDLYKAEICLVRNRLEKAKFGSRERGRNKNTNPEALAIQIAVELREESNNLKPKLETLYRIKIAIEERTPLRRLREQVTELIWKELFGENTPKPGEQGKLFEAWEKDNKDIQDKISL